MCKGHKNADCPPYVGTLTRGVICLCLYTRTSPHPTPPHMCCSVNFNAARGILWDPPALSNIDWPGYIDLTIYI